MVVTFETIRDIQRAEKENKNLVKLPDGIFNEISEYIRRKEMRHEDFLEVENAKNIIRDIVDRREHKIVDMAVMYVRSGVIPRNMTNEEELFFASLVKIIKEFRDSYYLAMIHGKSDEKNLQEEKEKSEEKNDRPPEVQVIQMTEDVPEFVFENRVYNLKKDEIASLPPELEEFLIKKGVAKRI